MTTITVRPPSASTAPQNPSFTAPPTDWLSGTWHVTHSTLPMWKSKRNVRITYTPLPSKTPEGTESGTDRIDDLVSYQALDSDKLKTIHGVDKASSEDSATWDWRGKGWLSVATSHWELLAWGGEGEEAWAVTYFAKTLFTPAGVDVYSRTKEGLSESMIEEIKKGLDEVPDEEFKKLAHELFEVKRDDARKD